jgi:SAM-dependent methyltransferase
LEVCDGKTGILEVGCGTGRVLNALLQKGFSVAGLDISSAMLSIRRGSPGSRYSPDVLRQDCDDKNACPGRRSIRIRITS